MDLARELIMYPEYIPVFTVDDIIPPPAKEFEDDQGRRSMVGWLKELFLIDYDPDDSNYIWISQESRKIYEKALDIARKECKMDKKTTAERWEEKATRKAQAAALNAVRKKLGYTQETYIWQE